MARPYAPGRVGSVGFVALPSPPISLGTTRLKWHRARRTAGDVPFTASRIVEGMRAGASVEVDLRIHADRGFAVLHDDDLPHATTGTGQVGRTAAAALRSLQLRDAHGTPCGQHVLLLEDLPGLFDGEPLPPSALLQLDFKQNAAALDRRAVEAFAAAVRGIEKHLILSCGDAAAVRILTESAPGISVGYDPCHHGAVDHVLASGDFAGFVERACSASPRATTIYLEIRLVLAAADRGFDLVGAFHRRGRIVDAYTLAGAANADAVPMVQRLRDLRVDQLTVDDAEGLVALLR